MNVRIIALAAAAAALFAGPAAFAANKPAPATAGQSAKTDSAPQAKHHKKAGAKKNTGTAPATAH